MATLAEQIAWETSLQQAQESAGREGKAVLLDFSAAPECKGCVAMDTVTYPDHRVAQFIEGHFIPARVRVKENPQLAEDYFVSWTPNVVIADDRGKVHYRVEGYLPPEEFIAHLSLGMGKYWFDHKQFIQAKERFDEVARRHAGTDAGAEALYWLGVAQYKLSQDPAQLLPSWQKLAQEYPGSEWTKRTRIPGMN
jgi:thioredoxin-related protein